jgi:hypothetical protein
MHEHVPLSDTNNIDVPGVMVEPVARSDVSNTVELDFIQTNLHYIF